VRGEKFFGDRKTNRMNGIPILEHHFSDLVDVKSAPHAKHTASRKAGLTHVAESEACQSIFP
jgi:hypothetical protein